MLVTHFYIHKIIFIHSVLFLEFLVLNVIFTFWKKVEEIVVKTCASQQQGSRFESGRRLGFYPLLKSIFYSQSNLLQTAKKNIRSRKNLKREEETSSTAKN